MLLSVSLCSGAARYSTAPTTTAASGAAGIVRPQRRSTALRGGCSSCSASRRRWFFSSFKSSVNQYSSKTGTPQQHVSLTQLLHSAVDKYDHHDALCYSEDNKRWTFKELKTHSTAMANGLILSDFPTGGTMMSMMPQMLDEPTLHIGTVQAKGVWLPVHPKTQVENVKSILEQFKPWGLVVHSTACDIEGMKSIFPEWKIDWASPDGEIRYKNFPFLRVVVHTDKAQYNGMAQMLTLNGGNLLPSEARRIRRTALPTDPAVIYGSQEAGWVQHSHESVANYGHFFGEQFGLSSSDRIAIMFPFSTAFSHSIGIWSCISHGAVAIIPTFKIKVEAQLKHLHEEKPTAIFSDVEGWKKLLQFEERAKYDLSTVKRGVIVDSVDKHDDALCEEIIKEFKLQELHSLSPAEGAMFNETDGGKGTLLPHLEGQITNDKGAVASLKTMGTLKVKGFVTGNKADKEGWLNTGVQLKMEEKGALLRK